MIDKWADEVSEICKKYSGKEWILVFNSTENGYDFHGFVGIEELRQELDGYKTLQKLTEDT